MTSKHVVGNVEQSDVQSFLIMYAIIASRNPMSNFFYGHAGFFWHQSGERQHLPKVSVDFQMFMKENDCI